MTATPRSVVPAPAANGLPARAGLGRSPSQHSIRQGFAFRVQTRGASASRRSPPFSRARARLRPARRRQPARRTARHVRASTAAPAGLGSQQPEHWLSYNWTFHELYNVPSSFTNDISVIYLPGLSARTPAPLDLAGALGQPGTMAAALGFGLLYTESSSSTSSSTTSSTDLAAASASAPASAPDPGIKPSQAPAEPYRVQLAVQGAPPRKRRGCRGSADQRPSQRTQISCTRSGDSAASEAALDPQDSMQGRSARLAEQRRRLLLL